MRLSSLVSSWLLYELAIVREGPAAAPEKSQSLENDPMDFIAVAKSFVRLLSGSLTDSE
jgi:hypothetical protein